MDFLADVIFSMLSEHPNATTILARAAHRLGYSEIIWGSVPGLATEPVQPIPPLCRRPRHPWLSIVRLHA